ncbi:hypothetical protein NC652_005554 [Populus alba x Populus x berolinensis]|nr:hypothetical protein NC652_005554 [Populus alba x Populus x berolinensis]
MSWRYRDQGPVGYQQFQVATSTALLYPFSFTRSLLPVVIAPWIALGTLHHGAASGHSPLSNEMTSSIRHVILFSWYVDLLSYMWSHHTAGISGFFPKLDEVDCEVPSEQSYSSIYNAGPASSTLVVKRAMLILTGWSGCFGESSPT